MSSLKYKLIRAFSEESGYSEDAINSKIDKGIWIEGLHWLKSPDNRRWIIIDGINKWLESTLELEPQQKTALKSTSSIKTKGVVKGLSSSPQPLI